MYTVTPLDDTLTGPFYETFAALYENLSVKPLPNRLPVIPPGLLTMSGGAVASLLPGLRPFLGALYQAAGEAYIPEVAEKFDPQPFTSVPANDNVMVAFSGGKDSLAAALKLKEQGRNVTLCHVRGINRAYPHEIYYSAALADKLGMPLVELKVQVTGSGDFVENPVKNHFILALMVEYGWRQGISTYAFGCDDHLGTTVNPNYNMSDAIELFALLVPFYRQYMPQFNVVNPIANGTDAYYTVYRLRPDLFKEGAFASCMMPSYRKPAIRKANLAKGIKLEESRCGSCKKCAYEYIHAALFGVSDYDATYFGRCIESLRKHAESNHPTATKFTAAQAVAQYVDIPFLRRMGVDVSRLPQ